jgi:hypothetical protein
LTDDFVQKIPTLESLEKRFSFVENDMLRSNAAIYLRHIIFLLALSEDENIGSLKYTTYKDIIIFTASIVESVLEYAINRYIVDGKAAKDVFGFAIKNIDVGTIDHECDDLYLSKLCVVRRSKRPKSETGDEITFNDINKAAKKSGVLDEVLFKKADKLREMRNLIHLQSLTRSSDDYFEKRDVEDAFKSANLILRRVESVL